jgi:hypothetical protein
LIEDISCSPLTITGNFTPAATGMLDGGLGIDLTGGFTLAKGDSLTSSISAASRVSSPVRRRGRVRPPRRCQLAERGATATARRCRGKYRPAGDWLLFRDAGLEGYTASSQRCLKVHILFLIDIA